MNTSSKFLQLTPYALMEYQYNSTVISSADAGFLRIKNAFTGSLSYLSFNPYDYSKVRDLTGNVLDRTVQQIGESTWAHFDMDKPISYFETKYRALFFEHLWGQFQQEINIVYDTVKIHLQSGYSFSNLAGFILRVAYVDDTFQSLYVTNLGFLKEDELIEYETKPFLLGDRYYDRYVQVRVPSLKNIIDINNNLGSAFSTVDGVYLTKPFNWTNSRINVFFYEIKDSEVDRDGTLLLRTPIKVDSEDNSIVRVELKNYDEYSNISAVIQESSVGDYFEIYPSYNGGFFDNFIYDRAAFGESYIVIHEIEVYEQALVDGAYSEMLSQRFTQVQDSGFDEPFIFRPVIKDNNSLAFSIDYTIRILNKTDSSQIIRKGSLSYANARKYGRWLQKINTNFGFTPIKIVNKILRADQLGEYANSNVYGLMLPNSTENGSISTIQNSGIPIMSNQISVNSNTLFVDSVSNKVITVGTSTTNSTTFNLKDFLKSSIIFGQGEATIYLNEFDNFVRFEIYKYDPSVNPSPVLYTNISSGTNINFILSFTGPNGEQIQVSEYSEYDTLNIEKKPGQLLFKVDAQTARSILSSTNKNFNIVIQSIKTVTDVSGSNNTTQKKDYEVVLYSGLFDHMNNYTRATDPGYVLMEKFLNNLAADIATKNLLLSNLKNDFASFLSIVSKAVQQDEQKKLLDNIAATLDALVK